MVQGGRLADGADQTTFGTVNPRSITAELTGVNGHEEARADRHEISGSVDIKIPDVWSLKTGGGCPDLSSTAPRTRPPDLIVQGVCTRGTRASTGMRLSRQ